MQKSKFVNDTGWPDPWAYYYLAILFAFICLPFSFPLYYKTEQMFIAIDTDNGDLYWDARKAAICLSIVGFSIFITLAIAVAILLYVTGEL